MTVGPFRSTRLAKSPEKTAYSSGGRRAFQLVACSYAQPMRSTLASSPAWQRIWSESGMPSVEKPQGIARPQRPR